jgi:hypothetical protein
MTPKADLRRSQSGFALVLALLTLMMLTFLGLTLAATTSSELQIAQNYKWNQQAYYNAEAGLELAKRFMLKQTWSVLLPKARKTPAELTVGQPMPTWTLARADAAGNATRNWENSGCDTAQGYQGVGYGVVLDHENFTYPFQNVSTFFGQPIPGSFTAWVRRPIKRNNDGTLVDDSTDTNLTITVEGTAPYANAAAGSAFGVRNRAVRVLQTDLTIVDLGNCENDFSGQSGLSALNPNYDPCGKINFAGVPNATKEVNPNQ